MFTELINLLSEDKVKLKEPFKKHTTFHIGGPADCMVFPETIDDLKTALSFCLQNGLSPFVFGLGSNLLVSDKGLRGLSIKIGERFKGVSVSENNLTALAGTSLAQCAKEAARNALGGLEFAEGIPGGIAGAVVMNAGAYDGEMKDVAEEVSVINLSGQVNLLKKEELEFNYRRSRFSQSQEIIIQVKLQLYKDDKQKIFQKMKDLAEIRRAKQPLDYPSAGSAFKRPKGLYVGPLLEEMGLKGHKIGGAQVSEKHAGFIINTGNAAAADVFNLITDIQTKVFEKHGIILEPEIIIVGDF